MNAPLSSGFLARAETAIAAAAEHTIAREIATLAAADEAAIETGARLLLAYPHRADWIIPGASQMTAAEVARTVTRMLGHPLPRGRAIGLRQLRRAADSPAWGPAWATSSEAEERALSHARKEPQT